MVIRKKRERERETRISKILVVTPSYELLQILHIAFEAVEQQNPPN